MKTKSFRFGTALVLAMLVLAVAGAVVPAQAQTYTVLARFVTNTGNSPAGPVGIDAIAQGRDGNLYSTSTSGGNGGFGTVFSITPSGTVSVLFLFGFGTEGLNPQDRKSTRLNSSHT